MAAIIRSRPSAIASSSCRSPRDHTASIPARKAWRRSLSALNLCTPAARAARTSSSIVREDDTKSGKARVIDLDEGTVSVLREHRVAQARERLSLGERWLDEDLVFARGSYRLRDGHAAGGPLHPERVSRLFDARVRAAGLPDVRLHDLRHTWATLALLEGVPVKVVQERLGHATPQVTMSVYQHVMPGMQRDAAAAVAALFA